MTAKMIMFEAFAIMNVCYLDLQRKKKNANEDSKRSLTIETKISKVEQTSKC